MRKDHRAPFKNYNNKVIADTVDLWIKGENERHILKRWLIDRATFETIAAEINRSPRYCQDLAYKNEMILFEHLQL